MGLLTLVEDRPTPKAVYSESDYSPGVEGCWVLTIVAARLESVHLRSHRLLRIMHDRIR